jgi:hypothetical protein
MQAMDAARTGRVQDMDILLGGIPRSGTTALARAVALHPEIFCWSSESALLPVMDQVTMGLPMRRENQLLVERMLFRQLKSVLIDKSDWHREIIGVVPTVELTLEAVHRLAVDATGILGKNLRRDQALQECGQLLARFFRQYTTRRLIAEKTPSNALLVPGMLGLARRWLVTHREPFAVIASMYARSTADPWGEVMAGEIEQRVGLYSRHAQCIASAGLHSTEVMVVPFDELLSNPSHTLARACAFLGVESTSDYLDRVVGIVGGPTTTDAWERVTPLNRWKILHLCASEMSALGYSQDYYQVPFEHMIQGTPKALESCIEPLYGVFKAAEPDRLAWMQRSSSLAVYAPIGINTLVLRIYNQISPLIEHSCAPGLAVDDLRIQAHNIGPDNCSVLLSELSLASDFCKDWLIDLHAAEPVGHHGNWRLLRINFETNFAYTPCLTLVDAADERTFSVGLAGCRLEV